MNYIYHEKQDGALCGQHCINNLLQNDYFTAVELATIAEEMDQEEKSRMAESGIHTSDFQYFLEQPSSNMDDSGMFSIQVLTKALQTFGLSLVNYASSQPLAARAQRNPTDQCAYICNFKEHWFTIRKVGYQWFNLNSLLTFPELISDTYLSLFLKQLQHEGYSIFVVEGELPVTKADAVLKVNPAEQTIKPQLMTQEAASPSNSTEEQEFQAALAASLARACVTQESRSGGENSRSFPVAQSQSEEELQAALRMSLEQPNDNDYEAEDEDYKRAIQLSLEASSPRPEHESRKMADVDQELEEYKQAVRLSLEASSSSPVKKTPEKSNDEERELEAALQMSLDTSLLEVNVPENPVEMDIEEVRRKRLEKLDKKNH